MAGGTMKLSSTSSTRLAENGRTEGSMAEPGLGLSLLEGLLTNAFFQ